MEQFDDNEKILVAGFFLKSGLNWGKFITAIAAAAGVPVPEGIEDL
jgi:hypothetical protein